MSSTFEFDPDPPGRGTLRSALIDAATPTASESALDAVLKKLPPAARRAALEEGAQEAARAIGADVVREALRRSGKTLREIQEETGLDPAMISRIATGHHKTGPHVWSLLVIARALGLNVKIVLD